MTLRELILGKNNFILSHIDYKRALLTGQLCLLTFSLCVGYVTIDLYHHVYHSWIFQTSCALTALVCFLLNRAKFYSMAKILLGIGINITVFIFSTVEPEEVGLYMFYIPTSLGAFAAFDYQERWKSLLLIILPVSLFILSQVTDFEVIAKSSHREDLNQLNLIINFIGSLLSSLLIIYFLINVNYRRETSLIENEKEISAKNSELTKLNTELDRFVYSTSHDLMAPLSSLKGLIHLAKLTEDPKEIRECTQMMEGRVNSLQKFIRDISDYARNTRTDVIKEKILINKITRSVLENLTFYPHAEKIKILFNIPPDLEIISDPSRIQIIISNLISNAMKYSDLTKENPFIKINAAIDNNNFQLQIEDNGVGIRADYINNIFNMFYQANEKSEGSGLGLYIVKQAIEKLNGTITVTSTHQIGTTFQIRIPSGTNSL
jgi:signal transduction histidine kinase